MAISIEQARIQLNMLNASDAEVQVAAKAAGLEIDVNLTGIKNTASTSQLNANTGFSVFGGNQQQTSNNFGLNFNTGNTMFNTQRTMSGANLTQNQSIFGNQQQTTFNTDFTNLSLSTDKKSGFDLGLPKFNIGEFNTSFIKNFDTENLKMTSMLSNKKTMEEGIDKSRVVSQEFQDGKIVYTYDDGQTITKDSDIKDGKIAKLEYKDGKVITTKADGTTEERQAAFGERGYVKDGNNLEEDMQASVGKTYEKVNKRIEANNQEIASLKETIAADEKNIAQLEEMYTQLKETEPEKAEKLQAQLGQYKAEKTKSEEKIANLEAKNKKEEAHLQAEYVKSVYKNAKSADEAKQYFDSILRNTDISSNENAQQFVAMMTSFQKTAKEKGLSEDDLYDMFKQMQTRTDDVEGQAEAVVGSIAGAGEGNPEFQLTMHRSYTRAAVETGHTDAVAQATVTNLTQFDEQVTQAVLENSFDADGKATLKALDKQIDVEDNGYTDNTYSAVANATTNYGVQNNDVEAASVAVRATANIEDAQKAIEQTTANFEAVEKGSEEIQKAFLTEQAIHGSEYTEDAQAEVDAIARNHDKDNVYNITAANYIQNYTNADIQRTIIDRTMESGNEDAMTNVANHTYEYDLSNRDDVIKMLKEQGSEKTLAALEESRKAYEEQAKAQKDILDTKKEIAKIEENNQNQATSVQAEKTQTKVQKTETKTVNVVRTNNNDENTTVERTSTFSFAHNTNTNFALNGGLVSPQAASNMVMSTKFRTAEPQEKVAMLNKLDARAKKEAISTLVDNTNIYSMQSLLISGMRQDVIKYLITNPTPENKSKLQMIDKFLTAADRQMIEQLKLFTQSSVERKEEKMEEQQKKNPFGM